MDVWIALGFFLAMMNSAAINIVYNVYVDTCDLLFSGIYLALELVGHTMTVRPFEKLPHCLPQWPYHFTLPAMHEGSSYFSLILLN